MPRDRAPVARRWAALAAWVAVVYASLPVGPRLGLAILRTAPGSWLLGPGLTLAALAGAGALIVRLRRRGAPAWAYAALVVAAAAYVAAFDSLRTARLERTHLPEYGVVAWLAWRALEPLLPGTAPAYLAAAALGAAIGWGDELLQKILPGRYYDLRDVGLNALGASLAMLVVAAARARRPPADASHAEPVRVSAGS